LTYLNSYDSEHELKEEGDEHDVTDGFHSHDDALKKVNILMKL
jgi:hypothetical protein